MTLQENVDFYRRYMGDGIMRLKKEKPEVWQKRMEYLSEVDGLACRQKVKSYDRWLFDYCFGDVE